MNFAVISPINLLQFTRYSPTQFILAQLWKYPEYAKHYLNLVAQPGYNFILDNGAAEKELVDSDTYEKVIQNLQKQLLSCWGTETNLTIVLPDLVGGGNDSLKVSLASLEWMPTSSAAKYMVAIQPDHGETFDKWLDRLSFTTNFFVEKGWMDKLVIGLPKVMGWYYGMGIRIRAAKMLNLRGLKGHALGMLDKHLPDELFFLEEEGLLSCDSSVPMTLAVNGLSFFSYKQLVKRFQSTGDYHYVLNPVDLAKPQHLPSVSLAFENLEVCGVTIR